ncbi:MAG: hypothetical protein A3F72_08165 [Bacteroidetes bacterium RIFCSPLOWO2_12_FULL_35_15]|nr:MAG: hypothetical protein A3F72_08165 [Bacteroidetes bacterium RIFCSPLOWO2_12_FULL_35_15]
MKKTCLAQWGAISAVVLQCAIFNTQSVFSQNIGINTTGKVPNASALLDVGDGNSITGGDTKGLLIPRVALTNAGTANHSAGVVPSPNNKLIVFNTNAGVSNGNGIGLYYYDSTNATTGKWVFIATASNGPGTTGQVLSSQGSGNAPQWSTLSTSGGGQTGCAACITETSVGTSGTWATCRNSCVAMGAGWRMPTWDEETYIGSGALGTPTGGWQGTVWTSTPWDARVAGTPTFNTWVVFTESTGDWYGGNYTGIYDCRCVR